MRKPEANQQGVRSKIVQCVFAEPDQGFHQRGRIASRFCCKTVSFIFVVTAPRVRGDPEQDSQGLNQQEKED
jgi:hypothetical protein